MWYSNERIYDVNCLHNTLTHWKIVYLQFKIIERNHLIETLHVDTDH